MCKPKRIIRTCSDLAHTTLARHPRGKSFDVRPCVDASHRIHSHLIQMVSHTLYDYHLVAGGCEEHPLASSKILARGSPFRRACLLFTAEWALDLGGALTWQNSTSGQTITPRINYTYDSSPCGLCMFGAIALCSRLRTLVNHPWMLIRTTSRGSNRGIRSTYYDWLLGTVGISIS